jgi:hypothetical protein
MWKCCQVKSRLQRRVRSGEIGWKKFATLVYQLQMTVRELRQKAKILNDWSIPTACLTWTSSATCVGFCPVPFWVLPTWVLLDSSLSFWASVNYSERRRNERVSAHRSETEPTNRNSRCQKSKQREHMKSKWCGSNAPRLIFKKKNTRQTKGPFIFVNRSQRSRTQPHNTPETSKKKQETYSWPQPS